VERFWRRFTGYWHFDLVPHGRARTFHQDNARGRLTRGWWLLVAGCWLPVPGS